MAGMGSAVWVYILLALAMYVFAVLGTELFGKSTSLQQSLDENNKNVDIDALFGTIPRSLVTLFQMFADDALVSEIMRPIGEVQPTAWILFILYVSIVSMGLLQMLSAVFIDSLLSEKQERERVIVQQKDRLKAELVQLVSAVFSTLDEDGDGKLSSSDLQRGLSFISSPSVNSLLDMIDVDKSLLMDAIRYADIDGQGSITEEDFTNSVVSLMEAPRAAQVRELFQRVVAVEANMDTANKRLRRQLRMQDRKLDKILAHLGVTPPSDPPSEEDWEAAPQESPLRETP